MRIAATVYVPTMTSDERDFVLKSLKQGMPYYLPAEYDEQMTNTALLTAERRYPDAPPFQRLLRIKKTLYPVGGLTHYRYISIVDTPSWILFPDVGCAFGIEGYSSFTDGTPTEILKRSMKVFFTEQEVIERPAFVQRTMIRVLNMRTKEIKTTYGSAKLGISSD